MNVLMPQLGETVAEGKITKWFKSAGDAVAPGDNLFEIETDKVSMEVPATSAGVLSEIRVPAGDVAPVGAVVAVIADGPGETAEKTSTASGTAPVPSPPLQAGEGRSLANPPPPAGEGRVGGSPRSQAVERKLIALDPFLEVRTPERNFGPARLPGGVTLTPLARRLAAESGIDLAQLRGTGPHGRIVARDIEAAPRFEQKHAPEGRSADRIKSLYAADAYEEVPLDAMRRTIAARLTEAQTVPHFYLTADVDIGRLIALREEANAGAAGPLPGPPPQAGEGTATAFKLSLNDFLIRAWALALQRVPAANAVWAGARLLRLKHCDIGVAIALDDGLVAPVIRHADTKSVSMISAEMKDLSARARAKKLVSDDLQGGSSAISNLGMFGVREFAAIINPPHATILAVGAARRQAVETADGGVAFASLLSVTVSCDHRVLDGALGARLLAAFKQLVEAPVRMLV